MDTLWQGGQEEVNMSEFRALVLREVSEGKVEPGVATLSETALPEGDVTVAVEFSTLNYKDGMILQGLGRLVRRYPHVPGIDFAGTVERSDSPRFKPGDKVILTGWRVGELHWGGYAQKARVKADWLVPLPEAMTTGQAMAVGTAGFSAMLSVIALERHGLRPEDGEVLVTGAAGGVGSVAITILHHLGYRVAASTGRPSEHDYLKDLGADSIIERAALATPSAKPLDRERWAGAIDAVGGTTLATLLTQLRSRASVASVGNAGGIEVSTTVLPFLLRGVNLLGIDSVMSPREEREEAWRRLARDLPRDKLGAMTSQARMADLPELGRQILQGGLRGRIVVDVNT
jgi:acrylyl-CoA reductase (NADPH)